MCVLTPWLNVQSDNRLGSWLGLAGLLLCVFLQSLLADLGGLCVLLLIVRAEEIDIVVILLLFWCLGWVEGELRGLWAVCGGSLAWVTWQRGEL